MFMRIGDVEQWGVGKIWQGFSDFGVMKCNEDVYLVVVFCSDDCVVVYFCCDKL